MVVPALCEEAASIVEPNRGSAFNSCIAMSLVDRIDGLYLISKLGIERCILGKSVILWDQAAGWPNPVSSPGIFRGGHEAIEVSRGSRGRVSNKLPPSGSA
jgi:hypothetical protein